jgi:phage-related minor tail protein
MPQHNIESAIDKELFEFRKQLEVLSATTNPLLAAVRAVETSRDISVSQVEQLRELADSYVTFVEDVKQASVSAIEGKLQELDTKIGFVA